MIYCLNISSVLEKRGRRKNRGSNLSGLLLSPSFLPLISSQAMEMILSRCALFGLANLSTNYMKNHGFLSPYNSPGYFIGTGTTPLNISRLSLNTVSESSDLPTISCDDDDDVAIFAALRIGTKTPHSQLLQVSFIVFELRSCDNLPHALAERLADPTYAQPAKSELDELVVGRTNISWSG